MTQSAVLLFAFAVATCFPITDVGAEEKTRSPNILWIVAENMGPDWCYGTPDWYDPLFGATEKAEPGKP